MITVLSTDAVSPAERSDFVRDAFSRANGWPVEFQPDHGTDFRFEVRYRDMGALRASLITFTTPYRVRRTPSLIRDSGRDLLTLAMALEGHASFSQGDHNVQVASGGFTVYAVSRPYGLRVHSALKGLQLSFPRTLLPLPRRQLERLAAVPMLAEPGIGALTSQLLAQLAAGIDHYSPVEAARIATAALDVLATRLAHELDETRWVPLRTRKHALVTSVFAFIQHHLADPQLSPGAIAAAHFMSTRSLHAVFQEQGVTVAAWIRQQRLEASRRDLTDPNLASRSVAAIAERWAFSSASQFTQAFKARYGMPPRDYRQQAIRGADFVRGCQRTV